MSNRLALPMLLFFLVVGIGVMAPMFVERFYDPPLPKLGLASEILPFTEERSPRDIAQLSGKILVASFRVHSFQEASCDGPCQTMSRNLSQLQELFAREAKFHFATFDIREDSSVNLKALENQLVLVDQDGEIRGYYRATKLKDLKRLKKHLHRLLDTPQNPKSF